jgi:large subunit ribosomal protein L1
MLRIATLSLLCACAARGFRFNGGIQQQQQQARRHAAPAMGVVASRRSTELREQVEDRLYQPGEAVALMKKLATAKFTETAELHGNLNLDPKYNDQQIRTTVSLPHGTGNAVRVAVLAEGAAADAAKAAGADLVGFEDLIEDISGGQLDFDVLLATPPAMPKLAKLGKVLGPKGLMPSPKAGTVSANPGEAVTEFKAGKLEFRTDKQGIVHVPFGKTDFDEAKLTENLMALASTIEKNRPTGCKGKLWNTATISSTMGPGIKIELAALKA